MSDIESRNFDRSDEEAWSIAARISSKLQIGAHRCRGNSENAVGNVSGGVAVVIPQQPAESLTTLDLSGHRTDFVTGLDQLVVEPLVISFRMIMPKEFGDSAAQ